VKATDFKGEGSLVGEKGAVGTGDGNATRDGRASCSVYDIGFEGKAARGDQRTVHPSP
jgi:hypothetical protein